MKKLLLVLELLKLFNEIEKVVTYLVKTLSILFNDVQVKFQKSQNHNRKVSIKRKNELFEIEYNNYLKFRSIGQGILSKLIPLLIIKYFVTKGTRKIVILFIKVGEKIIRVHELPKLSDRVLTLVPVVTYFLIISIILTVALLGIGLNIIQLVILLVILSTISYLTAISITLIWVNNLCKFDISNGKIIRLIIEFKEINYKEFTKVSKLVDKLSRKVNNPEQIVQYLSRLRLEILNNFELKIDEFSFEKIKHFLGLEKENVKIFLVNSSKCNAFSLKFFGNSLIVLTSSIVAQLNYDELLAVLAHEYSHIVHNDFKSLMTLISIELISRILLVYVISQFFNYLILIPTLLIHALTFYLIIAYIARRFEIRADKYAINYSGKIPFISALLKTSWRNIAQEFFSKNIASQIFSTHPLTYQRILNILQVR